MDEIAEVLKREISNILSIAPDDVDIEAPLHELGMNSMSFIELLLAIEREFKVKLIESDLSREYFLSIKVLAEHLASLTGSTRHGEG